MKKQIVINNEPVEVNVIEQSSNFVLFNFDGEEYGIKLESSQNGKLILSSNAKNSKIAQSDNCFVVNGFEIEVALPSKNRNKKASTSNGAMISPMPGKILKILKKVGEKVIAGDAILVMEAMKMEHTIKADSDGLIEAIYFKEGDQVSAKVVLVKIC